MDDETAPRGRTEDTQTVTQHRREAQGRGGGGGGATNKYTPPFTEEEGKARKEQEEQERIGVKQKSPRFSPRRCTRQREGAGREERSRPLSRWVTRFQDSPSLDFASPQRRPAFSAAARRPLCEKKEEEDELS